MHDVIWQNIITDTRQLDLDKIKILHPIKSGVNMFFGIKYEGRPLMIQTPFSYIKYNPMVFQNGNYKLDLQVSDENSPWATLEKHIVQRLSKKYKQYTENIFMSVQKLRLRSMNFKAIEFYDMMKSRISEHTLCAGDRVSVLIHVDKYIYTPQQSYINYTVVQVQKFTVHVPLFAPPLSKTPPISPENEQKYRKMVSIGVPESAVVHKMKMDGLPEDVINHFMNNGMKTTTACSNASTGRRAPPPPPPLPPPPPPPPPSRMPPSAAPSGDGMAQVFAAIHGGNFQLRKVDGTKNKGDPCDARCRILKTVDTCLKVPSLAEIQGALKNLRKIN